MKRLRSWWRAITKRESLEREMDAELRFHIDAYAADLAASGMNEDEAVRKAQIAFGNVEECKDLARESVGLRFWDELRNDLRYAMRMLRNSPGFAAVAILSLALGIGANTTIFSLAKAVLLDKLAVPDPDALRLFGWWEANENNGVVHDLWGASNIAAGGKLSTTTFSYPVYRTLRQDRRDFDEVFAFKPLGGYGRLTANIDGVADAVTGEMVSGNYYRGLGIRTALGRPIDETDDREDSPTVAVISDGFWARRFGRARDVIGKHIALNFAPVTIVGVNPPGFTGAASVQTAPDIFLPLSSQPVVMPMQDSPSLLRDTNMWWVLVMGRLRAGVSPQQAQSAYALALNRAVRATMTVSPGASLPQADLLPGSRGENLIASRSTQMKVLLGLVGFVLLLACSNIANLMLARAAARRREFSMRLALGASRERLVRQLMTESLCIAALGGAAGFFIGYSTRNLIPHFLSVAWERPGVDAQFDFSVLLFTAAISVLAGVLFGLVPAWKAVRDDLPRKSRTTDSPGAAKSAAFFFRLAPRPAACALYARTRERGLRTAQGRKSRAGHVLVVLQVALSLLLVVAAGLFVQTLANVEHQKLGFDPQNVLLFDIRPPESRYPGNNAQQLLRQIEDRLRAIPGVETVGHSQEALIAQSMSNTLLFHPGEKHSFNGDHSSYINDVNSDFFPAMRIPILNGRNFIASDEQEKDTTAIVNLAFVKKFFPHAGALGKTLEFVSQGAMRIVGICGDAKYTDAKENVPPTAYLFYLQSKHNNGGATFELRTRAKPDQIARAVRSAVRVVDPNLPVIDMRTQIEQIEATRMDERLFANLASGFAFLALAIAAVGVYGLMAFSIASRTNEIGIRMALGARAQQVVQMVLRETSLLALGGVLLGLAGSLAMMRLIRSLLYGLQPGDPATLTGASLLLLAAALAAAYVPARRAARIDPMQALRHE